jgi:hypothetical protein
VLDAIRTPLITSNFAEDGEPLVQQLVDDVVLGAILEILEGMLKGNVR